MFNIHSCKIHIIYIYTLNLFNMFDIHSRKIHIIYIYTLNLFDMFDLFVFFYIIALPSSLGIPSGKGMACTFTSGVGGTGSLARQFVVPKSQPLPRMS